MLLKIIGYILVGIAIIGMILFIMLCMALNDYVKEQEDKEQIEKIVKDIEDMKGIKSVK